VSRGSLGCQTGRLVAGGEARERTAVAGDLGKRAGDDAAVYVDGIAALHDVREGELMQPVTGERALCRF
jgi:hypothetical protein